MYVRNTSRPRTNVELERYNSFCEVLIAVSNSNCMATVPRFLKNVYKIRKLGT